MGASVAVVSMVAVYATTLALVLLYQTCGKFSVSLGLRKRFSSMFSLDRRRSSDHGEMNVGELELPGAVNNHISGAASLSASELLRELDALDAESADAGINPFEMNGIKEARSSSGLPMDMAHGCPHSREIEMQDAGIGSRPVLAESCIDLR
jgi:hypothetical protein